MIAPTAVTNCVSPELDAICPLIAAMVDAGVATKAEADAAAAGPLVVAPRALENEAPYFVDYVSQFVDQNFVDLLHRGAAVELHRLGEQDPTDSEPHGDRR